MTTLDYTHSFFSVAIKLDSVYDDNYRRYMLDFKYLYERFQRASYQFVSSKIGICLRPSHYDDDRLPKLDRVCMPTRFVHNILNV